MPDISSRAEIMCESSSRMTKSLVRPSHRLLFALVALFCAARLDAAENVVVYELDAAFNPVATPDRLEPMSDGMRAILAMYALQAGGGCDTHNENGELVCTLTHSLGLGAQCSPKHVAIVRSWFKKEIPKIKGVGDWTFKKTQAPGVLESMCYNQPDTATFQDVWENIRVTQHGDRVLIDAIDGWIAREFSGRNRYQSAYKITADSIEIISHRKVVISKRREQ
jgi:hypothetical protein